jgi:hypothetical protein
MIQHEFFTKKKTILYYRSTVITAVDESEQCIQTR